MTKSLLVFNKKHLSAIIASLTSHDTLRYHLKKMDNVSSAMYQFCSYRNSPQRGYKLFQMFNNHIKITVFTINIIVVIVKVTVKCLIIPPVI